MKFRTITIAAAGLLISAGIASAATVTNDLNLRSGPSTGYRVIDTMPAGAYVNVISCRGSWCRVNWHGRVGYASSSYIGGGRGAYARAPIYAAPPPVVQFGFGVGRPNRDWRHHRNWRNRRHHR